MNEKNLGNLGKSSKKNLNKNLKCYFFFNKKKSSNRKLDPLMRKYYQRVAQNKQDHCSSRNK